MKKIILSALTAGLLFIAQNVVAQVSVGPKVALNVASLQDKSKDASYVARNFQGKIGVQAGLMVNAQLSEYIAIRPELTFNSVGAKRTQGGTDYTFTTNYINLPLNFVGQYPVGQNIKIQAFAGPYAAYGLGGKMKYKGAAGNGTETINMEKNPDNTNNLYQQNPANNTGFYQNQLDFGVNVGGGFLVNSFVFSVSYTFGMTNLEPHYTNSTAEDNRGKYGQMTNRNISFGVAYLLGNTNSGTKKIR